MLSTASPAEGPCMGGVWRYVHPREGIAAPLVKRQSLQDGGRRAARPSETQTTERGCRSVRECWQIVVPSRRLVGLGHSAWCFSSSPVHIHHRSPLVHRRGTGTFCRGVHGYCRGRPRVARGWLCAHLLRSVKAVDVFAHPD